MTVDTYLSLGQIEVIMQGLTVQALGLDVTDWTDYQTALTGLKTVGVNALSPGSGYADNDVLTLIQTGASGGTFIVDTVDGSGVVLTGHIGNPGTGYALGTGLSTSGGLGMNCELDITAVNSWVGAVPANPYYAVRIQYPLAGAPAFKINEDVCFIHVAETDDRYNRQREVKSTLIDDDTTNLATSYTRVMSVLWTFYGPNSFENAQTIRDWLFYQQAKDVLAPENLFLIPDIMAPVHIHEPYDGQWWNRHDLRANFNELVIRNQTANWIESVDIEVTYSDGSINWPALNNAIYAGLITVTTSPNGLIMSSQNGEEWLIAPDNNGNLTATLQS